MKRLLAATALFLTASSAHASELTDKVRAYVPVYALASSCDIRVIGKAATSDHAAMLEGVKKDPEADRLLRDLQSGAQAEYVKARDAGNRIAFCKKFIADNSKFAMPRVTQVAEGYANISQPIRKAMAHGLCGQGSPVKLSKADREEYEIISRALKGERKIAKEIAAEHGSNATDEVNAVTEQFCAGVK